ncbi:MAG: glycosyltransferase family 39 protein [Anaerolineae bacterium]|nr:glycosyltransferase family 39 protein [Anaerolineae bacterium]
MMTIFGRYRSILPLLILGLAFALRLYHLNFQSIWWDEGHSIFVAAHPLSKIPTLPAMDVHPPAYFALLRLWLALAGSGEFALRYLSVFFSTLTVALLWRFAASLYRPSARPARALAAFLAALSPMYVAYAQEVRSYAMLAFLSAASTFTLWRLLSANRQKSTAYNQPKFLLFYILLTAACLYTHYFTVFLLIFHNLAWLAWLVFGLVPKLGLGTSKFTPKPATLKIRAGYWLASQAGILLLFTPQLSLALRQIAGYTNPNLIPPGPAHFIGRSWQAYTTGLTMDPIPARWGMAGIAAVLLVSWLIVFGANRAKLVIPFLFLTSWLAVPLAAYFIVLQRQPSFEPRYLIPATPALFLLLAVGLGAGSRVAGQKLRFLFYGLLAVPILVFGAGLHSYYTNETYFKDNSAAVTAWLAAETTPNDIIYFDVPHPFHYYQNRLAAPARYLFVDIHTAAAALTREAAGRDRLYWVTWFGSDTDPRGVIPFLAKKFGQQLGRRDFKGYRVEWFSLPKATTAFSLPTDLPSFNATFGNTLRLDGAAYSPVTAVNNPAWATLHFTLLRATDVDYKVSLRLRDENGQVVAQLDKDLLNDRHFRTSAWPIADPALNQALNVYTLPLAPDTPPGSYRLEVIVYNSQPPYPSEGVTGQISSDGAGAIVGHVIVEPGA